MIGAVWVSTRAKPPIGSNSGSADALRWRNGSVDWSVGSDSDDAASESAGVSPATTMIARGHVPTPHQSFAAARVGAPPEDGSGVSKG